MQDILPDLFDEHPDSLTLIPIQWQHFGAKTSFSGEVVTVRCFEDNSQVKSMLATPGHNKVLVVDGGGLTRRALLGDLIASSAVEQQWSGIIIFGCIRDVSAINAMSIGVKAIGVNPIKTEKRGLGDSNLPIEIAGVNITPGMTIYADLNGVAVSKQALL